MYQIERFECVRLTCKRTRVVRCSQHITPDDSSAWVSVCQWHWHRDTSPSDNGRYVSQRCALDCYQSLTFLLNLSRGCINLCYRHNLHRACWCSSTLMSPLTNHFRCPPDPILAQAFFIYWSNKTKWKDPTQYFLWLEGD